jgi:transposase
VLSRKFARQDILLVLDGAPNHRSGQLVVPENITLLFLPPYSPELNPKETLWDEIREKIFKNYALKSIDHVRQKLNEAILYVERNPDLISEIHHLVPLHRKVILIWKWYQFNLLEMTSPSVSPEHGVTRYQDDHTQGPACAIAAGAATIYRNYFAPVGGAEARRKSVISTD